MLNKDCVWILSATSFVKLDSLINLESVCVSNAKTIMKMGAESRSLALKYKSRKFICNYGKLNTFIYSWMLMFLIKKKYLINNNVLNNRSDPYT